MSEIEALRPIDTELLDAIRDCDARRIRLAISYGADPNGSNDGDSFLEDIFWLRSHEERMAVLGIMVALGAVPGSAVRQHGLLYVASFAMNATEIRFLLDHGANPNAPSDDPETTYDMIEFDYRYDLWDLRLPIEPVDADRESEATWLDYLDRCAEASGKERPEHLRLLRQFGALCWRERKMRRESRDKAGILRTIVSGRQTGADRAAQDWAVAEGIKFECTPKNVTDSDGTLIVNLGALDGGTLATLRYAEQLKRPCLVIQAKAARRAEQAEQLNLWLHEHRIVTLNVAGPRESKRPGIYVATYNLLCALLGCRFIWSRNEN